MIGTDTVSAGVNTTLSSATSVGASSISTAATIPAGSVIRIDTAANTEYATTGTPTGSGPFTIPIVGSTLALAHASGVAVVSQTTHTFAQAAPATRPPSYSFSVYDMVDYRGWAGCQMSELGIKIDPAGTVTVNPKYTGFPEATQSSFAYAAAAIDPLLGWQCESLALTLSQSGWTTGQRDLSGTYVSAAFDVSGINNATDGGVAKAVLKNWVASAY